MKILWCGPLFSDWALVSKLAPNQAASKWARGFLQGLSQAQCSIYGLSHCPEQRWPGGLFWQNNAPTLFLQAYPYTGISYLNVPCVKDLYLSLAYAAAARQLFRHQTFDAVVCYNTLHPFHVAVMREAQRAKIPSIPIILDGDDPRPDQWKKILHDARFASGIVFLSYWAVQHYPGNQPVYHMDGGADHWRGKIKKVNGNAPKTIVYTGALDQWRGVDFMASVVRLFSRKDVRFVFCGKCNKAEVLKKMGADPRLDIRGFVSDEELEQVLQSADVFLSVRDPHNGDNVLNYPSKIPHYLSYGSPIVSTWVESFSPDYKEVLCLAQDNTPEGFVQVLNTVLDWDQESVSAWYDKVRTWFENTKTWTIQAQHFTQWAQSVLPVRPPA